MLLQFYRQALEQNPIEMVSDEYHMFKVCSCCSMSMQICLQAVSDGWAFTYGNEYWMTYNAQRFCLLIVLWTCFVKHLQVQSTLHSVNVHSVNFAFSERL